VGEFPWDIVELMREQGLFRAAVRSSLRRSGCGPFALLVAIEEIAKACATSALTLSMQQLGSLPIKLAGDDAQKQR
jgi:alkylation response protein AidB-like acyl-CoA dehydrogenase